MFLGRCSSLRYLGVKEPGYGHGGPGYPMCVGSHWAEVAAPWRTILMNHLIICGKWEMSAWMRSLFPPFLLVMTSGEEGPPTKMYLNLRIRGNKGNACQTVSILFCLIRFIRLLQFLCLNLKPRQRTSLYARKSSSVGSILRQGRTYLDMPTQ